MSLLAETIDSIRPVSQAALAAANARQAMLTKPRGSLGVLEQLGARLSAMYDACPPPLAEPVAIAVFVGDHGVHARGVSPWPQEVTTQMVANFLDGGAVINALGRQIGAEVLVVDVGMIGDLPEQPGLWSRKVAAGTADMTTQPAMTQAQAVAALETGVEAAASLIRHGNRLLVTGDMGIANTTASAALISVLTGLDAAVVTGRGTGIDDEMLTHKMKVINEAIALHRPDRRAPLDVLAAVGGFEHAALAGFLLGAAAGGTPVVLDGVISCSAALVADALQPLARDHWIAGHRSVEPGASVALDSLGLVPLLDLELRLGEGSGAALAVSLVQSAARVLREVATFDSAGVTDKA
jgi:nicotinate-nucleotide--dimethylbenzimidazole phosphoribosyltransferase